MFGFFKEDENDKQLLESVVKYYQPSMRILSNGTGSWCLTMSPEDGRRTAKNKNEDEDEDEDDHEDD